MLLSFRFCENVFRFWKFVFLPTWLVFMHFALFSIIFSFSSQYLRNFTRFFSAFSSFSTQLNFRISFIFVFCKENCVCLCSGYGMTSMALFSFVYFGLWTDSEGFFLLSNCYARIYNENRCKINNSRKFPEKNVSIAFRIVYRNGFICKQQSQMEKKHFNGNWDNNNQRLTYNSTNRVLIYQRNENYLSDFAFYASMRFSFYSKWYFLCKKKHIIECENYIKTERLQS